MKELTQPSLIKKESQWNTEIEWVEKMKLSLSFEVFKKIADLSENMGALEWGGYLIGEKNQATDIVIPKQEVTGTTMEILEYPEKEIAKRTIIGSIHSHHTMGAFFSGTDHDFIGMNHPFTLVYSNYEFEGFYAVLLPDGNKFRMPVEIDIQYPEVETDAFLKEALTKISQKPVTIYQGYQGSSVQGSLGQTYPPTHAFTDKEIPSLEAETCQGCASKHKAGKTGLCRKCERQRIYEEEQANEDAEETALAMAKENKAECCQVCGLYLGKDNLDEKKICSDCRQFGGVFND